MLRLKLIVQPLNVFTKPRDFEDIFPDQATMEHIVFPAIGALRSKDIEGARIMLRIALGMLVWCFLHPMICDLFYLQMIHFLKNVSTPFMLYMVSFGKEHYIIIYS